MAKREVTDEMVSYEKAKDECLRMFLNMPISKFRSEIHDTEYNPESGIVNTFALFENKDEILKYADNDLSNVRKIIVNLARQNEDIRYNLFRHYLSVVTQGTTNIDLDTFILINSVFETTVGRESKNTDLVCLYIYRSADIYSSRGKIKAFYDFIINKRRRLPFVNNDKAYFEFLLFRATVNFIVYHKAPKVVRRFADPIPFESFEWILHTILCNKQRDSSCTFMNYPHINFINLFGNNDQYWNVYPISKNLVSAGIAITSLLDSPVPESLCDSLLEFIQNSFTELSGAGSVDKLCECGSCNAFLKKMYSEILRAYGNTFTEFIKKSRLDVIIPLSVNLSKSFTARWNEYLHLDAYSSTDPSVVFAEKNCPICRDSLDENKYIARCGHQFHEKCISEWTKIVDSCPICRTYIGMYSRDTCKRYSYYKNKITSSNYFKSSDTDWIGFRKVFNEITGTELR